MELWYDRREGMISGQIKLYEPPPKQVEVQDEFDYWTYGKYVPPNDKNWEEQISKTIEDALKKGFKIGSKVRRVWGNNNYGLHTGTVEYFVRGKEAYRVYSGRHEVLHIKWDTDYTSRCHPSELTIYRDWETDRKSVV